MKIGYCNEEPLASAVSASEASIARQSQQITIDPIECTKKQITTQHKFFTASKVCIEVKCNPVRLSSLKITSLGKSTN
ncbi:unnamed protein product [Protopolystoma xenopodis]|uniref:Uncharacterized protein n=1 Tax=Protopolystoma xenopodis TaxID=117903 RepID=A0A3S5ADD4_9PLAT|nr:unnamed protein product [Protopolystoma xenopodis]